jgi:hypothetical protein
MTVLPMFTLPQSIGLLLMGRLSPDQFPPGRFSGLKPGGSLLFGLSGRVPKPPSVIPPGKFGRVPAIPKSPGSVVGRSGFPMPRKSPKSPGAGRVVGLVKSGRSLGSLLPGRVKSPGREAIFGRPEGSVPGNVVGRLPGRFPGNFSGKEPGRFPGRSEPPPPAI